MMSSSSSTTRIFWVIPSFRPRASVLEGFICGGQALRERKCDLRREADLLGYAPILGHYPARFKPGEWTGSRLTSFQEVTVPCVAHATKSNTNLPWRTSLAQGRQAAGEVEQESSQRRATRRAHIPARLDRATACRASVGLGGARPWRGGPPRR